MDNLVKGTPQESLWSNLFILTGMSHGVERGRYLRGRRPSRGGLVGYDFQNDISSSYTYIKWVVKNVF